MGKFLFFTNATLAIVNAMMGSFGVALLCAIGALMATGLE